MTVGIPSGRSPRLSFGITRRELQHDVTVSPFLIAKYEVTQTEWKKVMGKDPPPGEFRWMRSREEVNLQR